MLVSCARMPAPVMLTPEIAAVLPPSCRQVLYVTAADDQATSAQVRMLERGAAHDWHAAGAAMPARIGRHGMAWGHGEFGLAAPAGWRIKREGDGCAPAGVFRIAQAFGEGERPGWMRLPYVQCTKHHWGIDDVRSRHYNRIVDDREVVCDWTGPETMIPSVGCYKLGAEIAHNPRCVPGLGSCIFLHLWQGESVATSGCTALSEANVRKILAWLDRTADPCLVQLVSGAQ